MTSVLRLQWRIVRKLVIFNGYDGWTIVGGHYSVRVLRTKQDELENGNTEYKGIFEYAAAPFYDGRQCG